MLTPFAAVVPSQPKHLHRCYMCYFTLLSTKFYVHICRILIAALIDALWRSPKKENLSYQLCNHLLEIINTCVSDWTVDVQNVHNSEQLQDFWSMLAWKLSLTSLKLIRTWNFICWWRLYESLIKWILRGDCFVKLLWSLFSWFGLFGAQLGLL